MRAQERAQAAELELARVRPLVPERWARESVAVLAPAEPRWSAQEQAAESRAQVLAPRLGSEQVPLQALEKAPERARRSLAEALAAAEPAAERLSLRVLEQERVEAPRVHGR